MSTRPQSARPLMPRLYPPRTRSRNKAPPLTMGKKGKRTPTNKSTMHKPSQGTLTNKSTLNLHTIYTANKRSINKNTINKANDRTATNKTTLNKTSMGSAAKSTHSKATAVRKRPRTRSTPSSPPGVRQRPDTPATIQTYQRLTYAPLMRHPNRQGQLNVDDPVKFDAIVHMQRCCIKPNATATAVRFEVVPEKKG